MPDETPFKELSDQILREMNAWNASHPQATFLQIEEKARELVSQLEAHLIQASALEREPEEWSQGEPSQRPSCARCPCSHEASACGMSKPQPDETFNYGEPTQPVPSVEPVFFPLDEQ